MNISKFKVGDQQKKVGSRQEAVGSRQVAVGSRWWTVNSTLIIPTTPNCLLPSAFCLLLLIALILPTQTTAQKPIPELWGQRIHDDAHVLKQETIDALEKRLKVYEDSTSNQIAILTTPSLDGEVLEEYSLKVAEAWKLGKKEKDNGVLLLIAVDDHKMRIEVGHGLEGILTDAHSSRIIRNELTPNFRKSDYDAGVTAAVDAMIKSIGGEYSAEDSGTEMSTTNLLLLIGVIMISVFFIGYAFYKEFTGTSSGSSSGKSKSSSSKGSSFSSSGSSSSSRSSFSGGGGSFGGGGSSGRW